MANSKIIVIEGAQGAGKTTITDYLRNSVKHTNLYRLSGISDSTKAGLQKSKKMYEDLNEYIKKMENLNINLLFDRTFFSEENYCRLGFKDYSFTEVYNKWKEEEISANDAIKMCGISKGTFYKLVHKYEEENKIV